MLIRVVSLALLLFAGDGSIPLPSDYREWVFLSAGLGMNYNPAATAEPAHPAFDNVFVNRAAYQQFLKTAAWPDGTTFILEIRSSASQGSINRSGHYQTALNAVEAEVKEHGQWTFYGFGSGTTGRPFPRTESCYSCHAKNGAVDNTFVQFYPTLLPVARQKGVFRATPETAALNFTPHTIASDLRGGYQVVAADMNHDGKPDLIALGQQMTDLVWYENPGWQRHVIVSNLPKMVNCAAEDIDGDGIPEIMIAWEFSKDAPASIGKVGLLRHHGDPREPWQLTPIDQLPTSHRVRWADIDGSGRKVALDAALTGTGVKAPEYTGDRAPIALYRPGAWKRETIDRSSEGVQHGISVVRWNPRDTRDSLLTASFSGIALLQFDGNSWRRTELAKGDSSPCPRCGASDVALGYTAGKRFLATIEPWHGDQVVLYREDAGRWQRTVADSGMADGHTILTADFDGDGNDEIVAGFRSGSKGVYLYSFDSSGGLHRHDLDAPGTGAASCVAADLNGDGRADIACISSGALKWFENAAPRP